MTGSSYWGASSAAAGRWGLVLVADLVVSVFEILGAGLVYLLLALVGNPDDAIELPVVGDLRSYFGAVDRRTLLLSLAVAMGVFFLLRAPPGSARPTCRTA